LLGSGERAFRMLSLARVEDFVEPGIAQGAPLAASLTLKDALAELLWSARDEAPVEKEGVVIGKLSRRQLIARAERPGA
jgi:osmoprotectant transport system ATP-binding protein